LLMLGTGGGRKGADVKGELGLLLKFEDVTELGAETHTGES